MAEPTQITSARQSAPGASEPVALDDVMIAMDVVDTLRHDDRIVARELNDAGRRAALIERLRDIYDGQGIDVPDHILQQGVDALAEDRFTYEPPPNSIPVRLAKLYVTRWSWGRYVIGAVAAIVLVWAANYLLFERPKQLQAEQVRRELSKTLPNEVAQLRAALETEARGADVKDRAAAMAVRARNAASSGDRQAARAARDDLTVLLDTVRRSYEVRVVNRQGELSGLWRIPKANPDTYNYYLVVEAVAPDGAILTLPIENEETGTRETVKTWAVRVPRDVLVKVDADKRDDGIIQDNVVGRKVVGETQRRWSIETAGGTLTRW